MIALVEARRKPAGLLRRPTFLLTASLAPASAVHLSEELARFEEAVRRWRERRGRGAERLELSVVVGPEIEAEVRLALDERLARPSFRALVAGLELAHALRVEGEAEPPRVRHPGHGVSHVAPAGWSCQRTVTGLRLTRDAGGATCDVTPGVDLAIGESPHEAIREGLARRGALVVDEQETAGHGGARAFTTIGRSDAAGEWVLATLVRHPALPEEFVRVFAVGTDLAAVGQGHDAVVATCRWAEAVVGV